MEKEPPTPPRSRRSSPSDRWWPWAPDGQRTTAFNLAAVAAIIVGFLGYNIFVALQGNWSLPDYKPPVTTQSAREILGFFVLVQGR